MNRLRGRDMVTAAMSSGHSTGNGPSVSNAVTLNSVVVNAAQTETILFGANGVAETLGKGAVFVSSATMDPDVARRLA